MNEWPIMSSRSTFDNKPLLINQSYDLEMRIKYAKDFNKNYHFEPIMLVSPPELIISFELIYKPWPFRMFGFNGYNLEFASEPQDCETHISDLVQWIL